MLFRKTSRNRRPERFDVLDVRNRAEPIRRKRRKLIFEALLTAIVALVVVFVGTYGWAWGRQRILDAGLFALKTIEVTTDGRWVAPDQVRQWAGVREGMNLLAIDLSRVRRDLELVPQIESASVERVLPHLLRLRISEREPVARVQAFALHNGTGFAPATYYLDASGVVMPAPAVGEVSASFLQMLDSLPVIRGVPQRDLCSGRRLEGRSIAAALQLLACFDHSAMAGQSEPESIDVAVPGLLRVRTEEGAEVTLADAGLEEQLRRWRLVRDAGLRMDRWVTSLDLSITNNCPLRWTEASNSPPVRPRPAKRPAKANKHV